MINTAAAVTPWHDCEVGMITWRMRLQLQPRAQQGGACATYSTAWGHCPTHGWHNTVWTQETGPHLSGWVPWRCAVLPVVLTMVYRDMCSSCSRGYDVDALPPHSPQPAAACVCVRRCCCNNHSCNYLCVRNEKAQAASDVLPTACTGRLASTRKRAAVSMRQRSV